MINDIAKKILLGLTIIVSTFAQAEILVILPETGPMANAADSIKRGLIQANHQSNNLYQFKFVDIHGQDVTDVLKKNVKRSTTLVIGPLDKANVELLLRVKPNIKVLALNHANGSAKDIYQFALSKEEDALALTKRMQWDGVTEVLVLRDQDTVAQTQSFYDAMQQLWGNKMTTAEKLPFFHKKHQGVLVLGSGSWVGKQKLPKKSIYTLPFAIDEEKPIPNGMVYCDTPALYTKQWDDVIQAYRQKPVILAFQRLIAFGGDAWQISDALHKRKNSTPIEFQGRTGNIHIVDNVISRQPQCFQSYEGNVKQLLQ